MSYVSLLRNIPELLSQPTGIAAIASLGIHGAIALIVPFMPANSGASSKADSAKPVGIMELSAADQSRLPQAPNTSQLALQQPQLPLQQSLPGFNLGNPSTIYPAVQPELSSQPVLPAIPSSPTNYNLSYLPSRQSIQRLTGNNLQTQISRLPSRSTYNPTTSPFVHDLDRKIRETESLGINRLPELRQNNEIPGEPLINPSAEPIDIGSTTVAGISPPQTIEAENNAVKIPQGGEKLALADTSSRKLPETLPSQQESTGKKTDQLLAKLNSYNTLRQNIRQEYPNVKEKGVIRETISTDTSEMEGTVLGRLVVDPDGKVLDIKFQEGTGSPKLQSKVREFFSANPPQADKRLTSSYSFQLKFQNNQNPSGVSSKIKPLETPNGEKVFTPRIQPSQTPNPEKVFVPQDAENRPESPSANTLNPVPSATPTNNPSTVSTESNQQLIQKLRQIKEERKNSQ
ncbi:hypothetical protein FJR11_03870 [Anabaena sp. UHCC 0187]|uniref:hypothetical protein n=1 Tax=Anabaena sp. UHCC 0187 TaxID=2590018 RepID=UPI0014453D08|nr:hypothetical protein [Anabaena sp. UHCC 0187]MTJ11746.1 hypothetical protein [Anabaena sp. UHCC 0187]